MATTDVDEAAHALGRRIEKARLARGWDKAKLARKAGVSATYVGRLERGEYTQPSYLRLEAIASALGVRVTDLTAVRPDVPGDVLDEVREICRSHEPLLRAVLADVRRYPPELRGGALELALQSLRALRAAHPGVLDAARSDARN